MVEEVDTKAEEFPEPDDLERVASEEVTAAPVPEAAEIEAVCGENG